MNPEKLPRTTRRTVIPGKREDLPKIAEQVILLGVPETGVYQRDSLNPK